MGLIKKQLEDTGLITVNLHSVVWDEYINSIGLNAIPVGVQGWILDYPDPSNVIDLFTCNGGMGNNITTAQAGTPCGVSQDPDVEKLVALLLQADEDSDQAGRIELYRQAQDIFADQVVIIPLFIKITPIGYRSELIYGSDQYTFPGTLNIGPAQILNYSLLKKVP